MSFYNHKAFNIHESCSKRGPDRAFSLRWPATMQIYGNKKMCVLKEKCGCHRIILVGCCDIM